MKLFLRSLMVGILCFALQNSYAQLSGNYTIPGAYPTLAAAITDLNTQGVSGAVTFTLTANETAPVGGYVINSFTGASATNTVTINASSGVVITAYTGTASGTTAATKLDAIFYLNGCDYVTLDGLTLQEDVANTTAAQWMEYGIAMVAPNASNGVQYCTIKNCSISLTRSYVATSGFQTPVSKNGNTAIYAAQHTMTNSTEVVPTSVDGAHSYNTIINNAISNVFNGVVMFGHASATANLPTGNKIGDTAGTGNTFTDFGSTTATGSGSCHAVRLRSQINCSVNYNTFTSLNAPHAGGHVFGIFLNGGSALSTYTTNNNTISVANATTSTTNSSARIFGIRSEQVATWTANGNIIENCVFNTALASGMTFNGIDINGTFTTVNITNNQIRNNTMFSTTTTTAIFRGLGSEAGTGTNLTLTGNEIYGNTIEGTGTKYHVYGQGTLTNSTINNNVIRNQTYPRAGTCYMMYAIGGSACNTQFNNNKIRNITSNAATTFYNFYTSSAGVAVCQGNKVSDFTQTGTGSVYNIYGFPSTSWLVKQDTVMNITSTGAGTTYGIYSSVATGSIEDCIVSDINGFGTIYGIYNSNTTGTVKNNLIENITSHTSSTTNAFYGIYTSNTTTTCFGNTIRNLTHNASTTGILAALYPVGGTTVNYYKNIVENISMPSGTTNRVYGFWGAATGTVNVYNNVINGVTATVGTDGSAANGLYVSAAGTYNFYNNTVRMSGTLNSGGASGLFINAAATVKAINNIFDINVTTSSPTKTSAVVRKISTATGTYDAASNNNMYWIPDASNHFYYVEAIATPFTNGYSPNTTPISGTSDPNFNTACSQFKLFMGGRESGSFYQQVTFNGNIPTGTTYAESGGQPLALVTDDFVGTTRGATPDIGAYEFGGTAISGSDVVPPLISYTNLANSICNTTVPLTVTITDASGVNVAAGSKPRVWYKKSTELDVLPASNTSADNGWKYVEAINSTSPFTFNIDLLQLNSLAVAGDIIQYFVAAQDNVGNVALNTVGLFGGYCTTTMSLPAGAFPTAAAPTKKSFTILAQPTSLTAVSSAPSICASGAVTMSLTGGVATGAEYQWQSSDSPTGTFSDISGANGATYTTTLSNSTQHRNFQCVVKCGGSPIITSSVVSVGYANPEVLATQGASRCGTGTLDLQATISANATANWYAAATGGTPIGTGTTFTTPAIAANTTYYVAAAEGGATSTVGRPATPLTNACGTAASTTATDYPIRFNTTAPVTLSSVTVIPAAAGAFTVALRQTLQSVNLQTYSTTFTAAQVGTPVVLPVNFVIPTPGQWQLSNTVGGGYRVGTFTNSGACAYPMTSALGGLSVVGSATVSTSATNTNTYNMFYDFVVQEGCESPRQAVTATVVQPPAITMPANVTMCSNDPAQPLTVSSSNAGYSYEWGPAAGLNTTSGATVQALPSSTTKYTVTATDNSGGTYNTCATTGDVTVTVNEIPSASDTKASKDTVCFADNVTFTLQNTGNAVGLTYQWQNSANGTNYVDVAGATAPTLTALVDATTNNYYQCVISCKGNPVLTSTPKQVFANTPTIVSTTGATRCGTGTVNLQAAVSASHTAKWYASATGGIALGSGNTFTTPQISATTDFYVAASGGGLAPTTIPGDGNWNHFTASGSFQTTTITGAYMILTVLQPLNLLSLDIYPSQAVGTAFTIEARTTSASGPMYATYSGTTTVQNTGTPSVAQTVPVNFNLQPGTYYIGFPTTNPGCWRSGAVTHTFPWTLSGVCSLDYYLTPSYQYYFYNLLVGTGCESPRQAVTATVTPSPGMAVTSDVTICSNDTGVALNATSTNTNYTYTWGPATGLSANVGATVTANPATTTQYTVTGTDTNTGCADVAQVKVSVNQVPTSADVKASVDTICFAGNTILSLINTSPTPSGVSYQWQSSASATGTFIDISAATAATYDASIAVGSDLHYRCNIGCINSLGTPAPTVTSSAKEMFIAQPAVASTTPGNRCGTGTVNLSATPNTPNETIRWYANATGGSPLALGNTFTTPVISTSTDFYVTSSGATKLTNVGLTAPPSYYAGTTGNYGIIFDAINPFTLYSVDLYPVAAANGTPGTVTIALQNSAGTTLQSITVNVTGYVAPLTAAAKNTVILNFQVPPGTGYRLTRTATTGITSLQYDCGIGGNCTTNFYNGAYPTSIPGVINQLGGHLNSATLYNYYVMYFYNWQVTTACESPRQAVTATVNTAVPITVSSDVTTCSAGPSQTLNVTSSNSNYFYTWSPATGLNSTTGGSVSALPPSTTTYSVTADDASTGCVQTSSIKVTVNPSPNNPVVVTTVNSTPCSTVTLLEGTNSHQPATAQMGNGTTLNTTTTWPCPLGNWYKGQRHQFIYTKAELDAIGMNVGSVLNALSMTVVTNSTSTALTDYTVKVGHTTKASFPTTVAFADWVDPTTLTTVFNTPSLAQPATGATLNIPFNTPFTWNGVDNIVIEFASCNGSSSAYTNNSLLNYTTLGANQCMYSFSDGTPGATVADYYAYTAANVTTHTSTANRTNLVFDYTKPADYTWSPSTNLFTDAALTTPYVSGTPAQKVWSKPPSTTTYTVSAVTPLGCAAAQNAQGTAPANSRFVELTGLGSTQVTALNSCDDNGWTNYYYNGKIFFAINWAPTGTLSPQNAIAKNGTAVKAVLDAAIAQCENSNGSKVYAMKRWWNVTTSFISQPVNVRFYYDPAEVAQVMSAAGGAGPTFDWFKNNTGAYNQATMVTGKNGIAGGNITNYAGTLGTDQGVNYVQYDNVSSFSGGGTGSATTAEAGLRVAAKVLLSHADPVTGLMDDYVKTLGNFPTSDPYSIAPLNTGFAHVSNPTVATTTPLVLGTTGNNAIVDWVFLELREGTSGATTVAQTRAALLQKDGDVVDVDGVSPVSFFGLPQSKYVAIRHRNHIGFRTDNLISLSPAATSLNFANNTTPAYGTFPHSQIGTNVYTMNGGDANYDGSIDAFDTITWEIENGLFDDYNNNSDYNMDGSVDAFDSIIWELNNGMYQELD